jgi:hypothetical protein
MKIGAWIVCASVALGGCNVFAHETAPNNDAYEHAWQDYSDSLREQLIASDRPREWVLAAVMLNFDALGNARPDAGPLFDRAVRSAPDDVFVQWTSAVYRIGNAPHLVLRNQADENVRALLRVEPDNAAAWMMSLVLASVRGDTDGVDDALRGMASGVRFDDHFVATLHEWFDAYDRHPLSTVQLHASQGHANDEDPAAQTVAKRTAAFAQASATMLAPYQHLIGACRPGTRNGDNGFRHIYCIEAARLMLERGNTLVTRSIGFVVLRNLGEATPHDEQQRRDVDWLRNAGSEAALSTFDRDLADAATYFADWRRLDDESDVMRSTLARSGLPVAAPGFWQVPTRTLTQSGPSN